MYYVPDVANCNARYTTSTGAISSPNYPDTYPEYANCTYILDIPDASHITIKFDYLELEYGADVLYFGLGPDPSLNNVDLRFTGYTTPDPLSIPYNQVWFMFLSDGKGRDTGFSFSWDTTTGTY